MFRIARLALVLSTASLAAAPLPERPRLGVLIVVDQLSAQAFDARAPSVRFGLKRMLSDGFRFKECRYEAAPTITSAGHATLVTGTYGEVHGIVSNEWVSHETGKPTLSTEDSAYRIVGRPPGRDGTAPTFLRAATLSDSVKLADERAKVVAISGKDRSAILTAGRSADAAIWLDSDKPFFTTSTFYSQEIPDWVKPTNDALAKLVLSDVFAWGLPGGGITGANPMPASGHTTDESHFAEKGALQPLFDRFEVDLAIAATKALSLGKDDATDLLVVSFSGHDRIGHQFGPDSPESLAEFSVIDREIGRLLEVLDKEVGQGRYVVALSSDHGVTPVPELSSARHVDSGRVDTQALKEALEAEAVSALGKGPWFAMAKSPGLYVTQAARAKIHSLDARLRAVARKQPGVLDLLSLPGVLSGELSGPVAALYKHGAFDDRSPDYFIVSRPYWVVGGKDGTAHGSAYLYDRAVPLVFFGGPIKRGVGGDVEAIDVAPTLSKLLVVPPPASSSGHALIF